MTSGFNLPIRILKVIGITLASLLGLVLLVLVALQVCIHTSVLDKTVLKLASGYVEGNLEIGDVNIRAFRSFPNVNLSVKDLCVTYPHDRFGEHASEMDEGRGETADTLISLSHLYVQADYRNLLKNHELQVRKLLLDGVRAFAYRYDTTVANWDIIRIPVSDKDTSSTESSSFSIDSYRLDELLISHPRIVFQDLPAGFAVTAAMDNLKADGSYAPEGDSSAVKIGLKVKDVDVQDLVSTIGVTYMRELAAVKTDALLSLELCADGYIHPDSLSLLPPVTASVSVPDASLSYARYFKDASFRLTAEGVNSVEDGFDVSVPDFSFSLDGLDLDASGGISDLLGANRVYTADAAAAAALDKVVRYLPESLRRFAASGNVDLALRGSISQSQLTAKDYTSADISGHLKGDLIAVDDAEDGLSCYLGHPDISVGLMNSILDGSDHALTLSGHLDSLDFNMGETLSAQGSNLALFGQNAAKAITEESVWHPFAGRVTADMLNLRYDDSLRVVLGESSNRFTVTGNQSGEDRLPYLRFETDNERLLLRSGSIRAVAHGTSAIATAKMRPKRRPDASRNVPDSLRRRNFSRALLDSAEMPDFLSEKDFRLSDIDIRLNNGITDLLRTWTPTGNVSIDYGMVVTPAFPLRNRFSGLYGSFKDDILVIDSVQLHSGTSDMTASLEARGLKRAMTRGSGIIGIDARLNSDFLNVNEILAAMKAGRGADTTAVSLAVVDESVSDSELEEMVAVDTLADTEGFEPGYSLIVVPANVDARLTVDAGKVGFSNLEFFNVHTALSMKERCLQMVDTKAETDMGSFSLDAFYSTRTKEDINAGFNLGLSDVTADRVIDLFPVIDEVVPMLKSFKGMLDCEMAATTQLDTNMNFQLPSINGMFKIGGRDLVLEDIGSLKKITKVLMFKDKTTGHIDDMTVNGVISDNSLEVFPFILSVDRYTVALNGIQSLNAGFDYHVSLIKSPLPFKIGVDIFGNDFSHWDFRIGRAKYRSTKIPLFNDAVESMQVNLVSSIRDIFSRGVDKALAESRQAQALIARRKQDLDYSAANADEILTREEQYQLDNYIIGQELDGEVDALNEEIDKLCLEMSLF